MSDDEVSVTPTENTPPMSVNTMQDGKAPALAFTYTVRATFEPSKKKLNIFLNFRYRCFGSSPRTCKLITPCIVLNFKTLSRGPNQKLSTFLFQQETEDTMFMDKGLTNFL